MVNGGGGVVDGLTICPTLLVVEVVVRTVVELTMGSLQVAALLAQNPPEPALPERNLHQLMDLNPQESGIGSTISPR